MNLQYIHVISFLSIISYANALEPFTIGAAAAAGAAILGIFSAYMTGPLDDVSERCDDNWIKQDIEGLRNALITRVHGQRSATDIVYQHVADHMTGGSERALALSFHGGYGVGKNFVKDIIVEHIYRKGVYSSFYHFMKGEFTNPVKLLKDKDNLRKKIQKQVRRCARSLFVIDEVDMVTPGVLDVISPFLDKDSVIDGVDYRKAIFIFLSNTAADTIMSITLEAIKSSGTKRSSIKIPNMQKLVADSSKKKNIKSRKNENEWDNSGWYQSHLLEHSKITAFVPFLPLEREHVEECIKDEVVRKKYFQHRAAMSRDAITRVLERLEFEPGENNKGPFSVDGCRRIDNIILEEK